jgi:hypothetical protein
MRIWDRTSASQHSAFQRCQRYWYYGWIERIERPKSPAMQRGTDIHSETEHYLNTGDLRDSAFTERELNYKPYVEALKPYLPPPGHSDLLIEQRIELAAIDGVSWLGFIDIGFSGVDPLQIRDLKTTSDFRYAKTPAELMDDIQLMSYAEWTYTVAGYSGEIDLGLIYVKTEKKLVRKKPKTKLVNIVVDEDHVHDVWAREMVIVGEMKDVASNCKNAHDLPPTVSACGMYGGCPFVAQCGLTGSDMLFGTKKEKGKGMNKFLNKLNKNKKKNGAEVLSKDAPSRTTETVADKAASAPDAKEKPAVKKKRTKKKTNGKAPFTIYVDCFPTKDVNADGVAPTLFEDWFGPIVMKMNEHALEEKKLPSYLLLGFAEEKALVAVAIKDAIDKGALPSVLVINSGTPSAKDAMGSLVPHATTVVKATRG